ncbi:MAG: zinc dependent phospholipase C family protein [Ruminococcus sp.]|nr:zinc dependent phospholipase C family protein [Ruminococcus sp.]
MSSLMMHLAVGYRLAERYDVGDRQRFLFGSVIPDAVPKEQSHFFLFYDNGTRKTYDLTGFRERYREHMRDGLYLGYYMHLIEDIVFRDYFYHTVGYVPADEKLKQLHDDYSVLNGYIIESCGIREIPDVPKGAEKEPLLREQGIEPAELMRELREGLKSRIAGRTVWFSRENADEYLKRAAAVCGEELRALAGLNSHIREKDFSWLKHN